MWVGHARHISMSHPTVSVTVHHKRAIVVGLVLVSLVRDGFHDELDKSVIDYDGF